MVRVRKRLERYGAFLIRDGKLYYGKGNGYETSRELKGGKNV